MLYTLSGIKRSLNKRLFRPWTKPGRMSFWTRAVNVWYPDHLKYSHKPILPFGFQDRSLQRVQLTLYLLYTRKMGVKRANTSDEVKESPDIKKKAKVASNGPLDPSLPNNKTFPETFDFPEKPEGTIKISSYNVASLNASVKKGFNKYVDSEDADILCIQETKVNSPVSTAVNDKVYKYRYWSYEDKKGYGGTAIFSKYKPLSVSYGVPGYEAKSRGRVITLSFPSFVIIACYVLNAGDKLKSLDERRVFNTHMEKYIRTLQKDKKSVIWCGDLNVAHTADDLARPKTNERSAGFTIEERTDFSKVLTPSSDGLPGLIDTWRHLHPDTKGHYTYYSYRFSCRDKLLGWRLDYFVITPDLLDKVVSCDIRHEAWGASDHVPLVLVLKDVKMEE
ncbi:Endonuclease/exonuclease/phosphatase [Phycomyces nitens]|nr:Endonuclease/exonuclease/phosphatase [Phycomyces nitens]